MAYLFVHFTGETSEGEQIYFSVSKDGLHWTDLGDGPVLWSDVGEKGVRDPFIVRNCVDRKFYIIATDLRIANDKGWESAQYDGSTSLIVWEAEDLIHWSKARKVEMKEMTGLGAGCVWAPEAIYDEEKEAYLVYWASMLERKQRIYAAWTRDFHNFTEVHPYIEKQGHIIDTTMAVEDDIYYRFSACEDYEGILMENGSNLDSVDHVAGGTDGITGTEKTEGPIITYLNDMNKWCLYVDDIGNGAGYVPFLADSLEEGRFCRVAAEGYDFGIRKKRHGSILTITDKEYESLITFYSIFEKREEIDLPAPLFRDPIFDAPTDPTIIWNREEKQWYLFYTQRRANDSDIGVAWVHGTAIGIASSKDGAKWLYRGTLSGLDIEKGHNTFWAPEIFWAEGCYHMYVSYITGIPTDWDYPRQMLHYTSSNLWDWSFQGRVDLGSERVIDACVYEISPHLYKMWYKDENQGSKTYAAISKDLYNWNVLGAEISDCAQEGPNVFELGGKKWLISDYWNGLAVYCSDDFTNWVRCRDILAESGVRLLDQGFAHHADVLVKNERAYLFYFCHPYAGEGNQEMSISENITARDKSRSVIQVAELVVKEGEIWCDRDAQVRW